MQLYLNGALQMSMFTYFTYILYRTAFYQQKTVCNKARYQSSKANDLRKTATHNKVHACLERHSVTSLMPSFCKIYSLFDLSAT